MEQDCDFSLRVLVLVSLPVQGQWKFQPCVSSFLFVLEAVLCAHGSYALISVWNDLSNIWAGDGGILEQCFDCISYSELILLYA